jgi:hypothetical protein
VPSKEHIVNNNSNSWIDSLNHRKTSMAKNTGDDYRKGSVNGRTQFERGDGLYQKRDEHTGHFMEVKQSEGKFKGVALEPDGRDTPNS